MIWVRGAGAWVILLMACGSRSELEAARGSNENAGHGGVASGGQASGGAFSADTNAGGSDTVGGSGGDPNEGCDVIVSTGSEFLLNEAIQEAPVPSTICLNASGFYPGPIWLKDGVSLRGIAEGVVICGVVEASSPEFVKLSLSNLMIVGQLWVRAGIDWTLDSVTIRLPTGGAAGCQSNSRVSVDIELGPEASVVALRAKHVALDSPGFVFASQSDLPIVVTVDVEQSRCQSSSQCFDFIVFQDSWLAAGGKVEISLVNNVIPREVLNSMSFAIHFDDPADESDSSIRIVNNTIFSEFDANPSLYFASDQGIPTVIANNAFGNVAGIANEFPRDATVVGNSVMPFGARNWFVDAENDDFHPRSDSPLVGAAVREYLPERDYFDVVRNSADIGAVAEISEK